MSKINLLDCTLRDGAYITDSMFGDNVIKGIMSSLANAKIEMIEVGWLKDKKREINSTYFNNAEDVEQFIPMKKNNSMYLIMMDYGRYDISQLNNYNGKSFDAVRLVFPLEKYKEAIEFSKQIKAKGYKLCLQAANTQSYSDYQLLELAQLCNEVMPESISIVDTFGVMYDNDLNRIFMILDNNLNKKIQIGFHSHNNLQLSFALSIEFIKLSQMTNRDIVIDSSLCGMGRGAGNTCTELITNYLNIKHNSNYDVNTVMDAIDIYMKYFIQNYTWGYSIPLCIAGQLGSHVNNIAYLQNNHNTNYRDMKIILQSLPVNERKLYNYDNLEEVYVNYQKKEVNDTSAIEKLRNELAQNELLFLSPGNSLHIEKNSIKQFIETKKPKVIGINFVSEDYCYDYLFFSNRTRYEYAKTQHPSILKNTKVIVTSNIMSSQENNEIIINYNTIMKLGWKYFDNSTIMAMRLFSKIGAKIINFAGFDGYDLNDEKLYSDSILQSDLDKNKRKELNDNILSMLEDFICRDKFNTKLNFITRSRFADVINRGHLINV